MASLGSGSGSVLARRIFSAIVSASSVRLMRDWSDGSDFDIFLVPSRSDITRVAGPWISGSGCGKNASPKPCAWIDSREVVVELLRDVARELEVLLLVLADRHMGGAIDQNVGGHQGRIGVEPDRGVLAVLAGLLLELGHAVEPAEPRDAVEDPGELGVLGDLALVEDDVLLRIDAAGDEGGGHLADRLRQLGRVLPDRDGVQVDDAIDAVVGLLQLDELHDRAEIVAEMQVAGRLHAGKHALLERHCGGLC